MPRGAACGSALPVGPLSLLQVQVPVRGRSDVLSRPRLSTSTAIALHVASLLSFCSAEPLSTGAAGRVSRPCSRTSWRSCIARSTGSSCTWQWIPSLCLTSFIQGVVRVFSILSQRSSLKLGSSVVCGPGVVVFPLEEQSLRLTTFNTRIEPPLPACTCGVRPSVSFYLIKGSGNFKVTRGALGCRLLELTRWELIVRKFQDHPLMSTRPLAFNDAASRPPAGIDSPAALAFNEAE